MDYICKLCRIKIESNAHFWDEHRQKISDYFKQHEPRETMDGKKVEFKKSIEEYFNTDFNSLKDRNTWVKANKEIGKGYILSLLIKRKQKKNWIYAPGQTLLRLSNLPSILWFEKEIKGTWGEICGNLDFKIRYANKIPKINWNSKVEITQDTREQKALILGKHIKLNCSKLDYGDYALTSNPKIAVERKSLSDAAGTLSAGYDRFKREIARAKEDGGYLVILVEASFNDFRSVEYLPQTKHIKSSYEHLAKRARDLYEEFDCFQLCFVAGRKEAARITEFILKAGDKVKSIDLQYCIDSKLI